MPPPPVQVRAILSVRTAVHLAKKLARKHWFRSAYESDCYFPSPSPGEQGAYDVLLDLELIDPDSYQWSARGQEVLGLGSFEFEAVFQCYLDRVLTSQGSDDRSTFGLLPIVNSVRTNTIPLEVGKTPAFQSLDRHQEFLTGPDAIRGHFAHHTNCPEEKSRTRH